MNTELLSDFEAHGLSCACIRVSYERDLVERLGCYFGLTEWINGYVRVPRDHPFHGISHYDPDLEYGTDEYRGQPMMMLDAHGGVNYSGMWPRRGFYRGGWWFGFDTNHSWDHESPKSLGYVESETRLLAEQIASVSVDDQGNVWKHNTGEETPDA